MRGGKTATARLSPVHEPNRKPAAVPYRALFEGGKTASAFEQLRQTRQQIDSILQVVVGDDGVLVQDFSGRIAYANGPAATLLGVATPEQLLRMPRDQLLATLVIRDEEGNDHSGELPGTSVLQGGGTSERTLQFISAARGERWLKVRTSAMRDDQGLIVSSVTVLRDVTDARRTADFRENLLGIASHDLRGPLSAIAMGAAGIARRSETLDPVVAKLVLLIQSSADKAVRMVHDLLDLAQARLGGGIPVSPREIDAGALLASIVDELSAIHPERDIVFRSTPVRTVHWDPDRIGQVIANLVANAVTYGDADRPVTVGLLEVGEQAAITVHNHGEEIGAQQIERMFQPFVRGSEVGRHQRSVGLGLYIVREIVAAHGGTVSAASTREAGTRFTVLLPRTPNTG